MFKRTTSINKILALKKRIKIIQGGTSAGKTFGILPVLIDKAARHEGIEISVVAETIPHLRRGALKDFLKIMKWTGRFFEDRFNKSPCWLIFDCFNIFLLCVPFINSGYTKRDILSWLVFG